MRFHLFALENTSAWAPSRGAGAMSKGAAPRAPVRVRLARGIEMDLRWIPAGDFVMGSRGEDRNEEPRHRVRIGRGFYLGTYPVTQAQFRAWTGRHQPPGGRHENHFKDRPNNPAEQLSYRDALAFCGWLNDARRRELAKSYPLPPGYVATLPTEAEWEYACRAGTDTEYYSGDGEPALDEAGWHDGNSRNETHPVGEKAPNGFGLHDMNGNVLEWCWDAYDTDAYKKRVDGVRDPGSRDREAWLRGEADARSSGDLSDRVIRGGSWNYTAWRGRSASRVRDWPVGRRDDLGFRVSLVPGPKTEVEGQRA